MCNQRGRCLIRLIYATILERFYMQWTFLARPTLYLVCPPSFMCWDLVRVWYWYQFYRTYCVETAKDDCGIVKTHSASSTRTTFTFHLFTDSCTPRTLFFLPPHLLLTLFHDTLWTLDWTIFRTIPPGHFAFSYLSRTFICSDPFLTLFHDPELFSTTLLFSLHPHQKNGPVIGDFLFHPHGMDS